MEKLYAFFYDRYNGFEINKHSGITCYIVDEECPKLNNVYIKLDWYQATQPGIKLQQ